MSADNVIYIKEIDNKFWVWHDFASNDNPKPEGYTVKTFINKDFAEDYAYELEDEIGYVEYGVQEFGWQKPINYDVISAIEKFK